MSTRTQFRLNKAAFMTELGETTQLSPVNRAVLKWTSRDETVATVSPDGLVTAVGNGDTVILAEAEGGDVAECMVSVGYHGQNPILPPTWGLFIADGEPHVFGGRMYIYGSRDNAFGIDPQGRFNFCSGDYHVIYSDDLLHWTDAGVAISVEDFPRKLRNPSEGESVEFLWAPDLFKAPHKDTYYLTFCSPNNHFYIAESASPTGPFENIRLITYRGKAIPNIDPGILTDDDGRVYMAMPSPFRLGELDPAAGYTEVKEGSIVSVQHLVEESPDGYYSFEGPSLRKFGGRYYFIYIASKKGEVCPVRMNYLVSDNIHEGWRFGGTIMDTHEYLAGVNVHGSFESWGDKFYLSYHRICPGFPQQVTREMSMDELRIREDGSIEPVIMTSSGVRGAFVRGDRIPSATAVFFSGGRGDCRFTLRGTESPEGSHIWHFSDYAFTHFDTVGQYNGYRYVKLSDCQTVTALVRTNGDGGTLCIRDTEANEILATLSLPNTRNQWAELTAPLAATPSGKREIVIELTTAPAEGRVELDWFKFV